MNAFNNIKSRWNLLSNLVNHQQLGKNFSKFGPTDLKSKNATAQKWLLRQMKDPYIRKAKQEDYRCRSAFKLLEIDNKFGILSPGQCVIDCGAAPGSWSQVVVERVNHSDECKKGIIISIDLLDIEPIDGVITLNRHDFTKKETQNTIKDHLKGQKVDLILSDMSPSVSGLKSLDHDLSIRQVLSVFKFALEHLKEGGTLLVKVFQGGQLEGLISLLEKHFEKVQIVKPQASRTNSSEFYILSRRFSI